MVSTTPTTEPRSGLFARGDVNAFFGLLLDNVSDMILMAGLLTVSYGFPREFVIGRMIPGTALGVLVGDLIYTFMAWRLARRTGRAVTAMPLGLDTPSTFGAVFLILGPAFVAAKARGLDPDSAARHAWFVGIAMILASGVFKLLCATIGGWIRRIVPRAGLLGSLVAIALVIISFLPLLDIAAQPISGLVALAVILASLTARWKMPKDLPGALVAVVLGCAVYYGLAICGLGPGPGADGNTPSWALRASLPIPAFAWWAWFGVHAADALSYLPVALPLALATVVGGIDCTESAAAAGDDYPTGAIIAAEGIATLAGGLFGGVIQSTPYIGHPAYKAMGARSGYTLATALFVGAAGVFGFFDWIYYLLPKPVVFPILIFVGLEITAQSFAATAKRHYPAVALACVPALAYLAQVNLNQLVPEFTKLGKTFADFPESTQHWLQTVTMLSGGFIVTSLLWGTALASLIDGKIRTAIATFLICAGLSLFGVIHSGLPSGPIATPGEAVRQLKAQGRDKASALQTPYHWAGAYVAVALTLAAIGKWGVPPVPGSLDDPKSI